MSALPLPPYGRRFVPLSPALAYRRRHGGSLFIFCGSAAWERAAERGPDFPLLVLPAERLPAAYHWPVGGWSAVVWDTGTPHGVIQALALALRQAGAGFTFHYREVQHA